MRKVRYIPNGIAYKTLSIGKVYDVIDYAMGLDGEEDGYNYIRVLNDEGIKDYFYIFTFNGIQDFIDVTIELRSEVIDNILE